MASIGHVAIGLAAARSQRHGRMPLRSFAAAALFWSALSLLPVREIATGLVMREDAE